MWGIGRGGPVELYDLRGGCPGIAPHDIDIVDDQPVVPFPLQEGRHPHRVGGPELRPHVLEVGTLAAEPEYIRVGQADFLLTDIGAVTEGYLRVRGPMLPHRELGGSPAAGLFPFGKPFPAIRQMAKRRPGAGFPDDLPGTVGRLLPAGRRPAGQRALPASRILTAALPLLRFPVHRSGRGAG